MRWPCELDACVIDAPALTKHLAYVYCRPVTLANRSCVKAACCCCRFSKTLKCVKTITICAPTGQSQESAKRMSSTWRAMTHIWACADSAVVHALSAPPMIRRADLQTEYVLAICLCLTCNRDTASENDTYIERFLLMEHVTSSLTTIMVGIGDYINGGRSDVVITYISYPVVTVVLAQACCSCHSLAQVIGLARFDLAIALLSLS